MILWNGDFSAGPTRYGYGDGWEYGGTFDGTPPLPDRVLAAPTLDGIVPPKGAPLVARITTSPGDQYGGSTGWRTLGHAWQSGGTGKRDAGYESWFTFALRMPAGYPGDANLWVSGLEIHHSSGVGTAPFGFRAYAPGDGFELILKGGDAANPTISLDHFDFGQGYNPNLWQVFALRYKHDPVHGAFELYYGQEGGSVSAIVIKDDVPTQYVGLTNYPLFGLYRDQTGTVPTIIYAAGVREYDTAADALEVATTMIGATPPPPPPPPPPPVDRFAAARAKVALFRKSSPNIAAAFDETFKALGQ